MLKSEIVTIGDEILIGQIVDTNSAWIGERFSRMGIPVTRITSVGDRRDEILGELDAAISRSEIVIVTGGLGPTKDDITKKVLSELFHCRMRRDRETFEYVKAMVERKGFEFNASNQSQADVPEVAVILKNHHGTAPGMMFERDGHLLFSLPGVPFEMKELIESAVIPEIAGRFELRNVIHKSVMTYGIAESVLSEHIAGWEDSLPEYLHLAYLPGPEGIKLRLSAYDMPEREPVEREIERRFAELKTLIPLNFMGGEESRLPIVIAEELKALGKKLFVVESCTGGSISSAITAFPGASGFFLGSITSYTAEIKEKLLGVSAETISKYSVVSRETVIEMAEGALKISGADFAIATTGNAGPTLDKDTLDDVGSVWIAVAETGKETLAHNVHLGKLRHENIARATSQALFMLHAVINGHRNFKPNTTFLI